MARLFRYYDDWEKEVFTCPQCGWKGTFDQGLVEMYEALMDSSCPDCDYLSTPMLAIVSWPTMDEMKENWDKVSPEDKAGYNHRKRFLARLEEMSLKSADELPDLPGSSITITWDYERVDSESYTVLKHGENEIWREPAIYEGYERFAEVAAILKERYGENLTDVIPTSSSDLYLYGDAWGAIGSIDGVRRRILGVDLD